MNTAETLEKALHLVHRRQRLEEVKTGESAEFWAALWRINRGPMAAAVAELRACPAPAGHYAAEHAELVEYSAASAERFISFCDA